MFDWRGRPAPLMFVRDERPITAANTIDPSTQSEPFRFEVERMPLALFIASKLNVKPPAGVDPGVGEPYKLDVFEIVEPLAIGERVKGMNG